MNNICIIGKLGRDVEISYSKDNKAIGKFTVAVNRKFDKSKTDWFNCVAFGKSAEIIEKYIKKGDGIGINGEIQFGNYENKEGIKIFTTTLVVNSFDFVGGNNNNNANTSQGNFEADIEPVDNSDMPF